VGFSFVGVQLFQLGDELFLKLVVIASGGATTTSIAVAAAVAIVPGGFVGERALGSAQCQISHIDRFELRFDLCPIVDKLHVAARGAEGEVAIVFKPGLKVPWPTLAFASFSNSPTSIAWPTLER
jgi:hypothetical protein